MNLAQQNVDWWHLGTSRLCNKAVTAWAYGDEAYYKLYSDQWTVAHRRFKEARLELLTSIFLNGKNTDSTNE